MEQSNANADPDALLAALHAERETAEQEARRIAEEAEDEAELSKYFSKVQNGNGATDKGKGKAKAVDVEGEADGEADGGEDGEKSDDEDTALPGLTIKRRPAPGAGTLNEPTVASLLAAKGKILDGGNGSTGAASGAANGSSTAQQQVKRKREGMQKLLGIKKKSKV